MQRLTQLLIATAALLLAPAVAQTFTDCNPMNQTCPNDPALGMHHDFVFNASSVVTDAFNQTVGALQYGTDGAEFTINKKGDSPTIVSKFYIFFGSVSVIMKTSKGTGIISSIVLQSDDLDEVDWEFMGGNATHAMTNYFGKGNTTSFDRAVYYPVSSDVRENFHNYTLDWTQERLVWMIDGQAVRTLKFEDANGGRNYPQTPSTLRLGIWAGGDDSMPKGTVEWAGGRTTYEDTPYTMYVQSAAVTDYSTGKEYEWTDQSGSWQSIKAIQGNSTVATDIVKGANRQPSKSLGEKFAALPQGTRIAVIASAGSAGALALGAFLFFCCRMRRAGRREHDEYNKLVEQQRQESYREQMELRSKGLGGFRDSSVPSTPSIPPSPAVLSEKGSYFGGDSHGGNGYASLPPRSPGIGGLSPIEPPSRSMTASPLERTMSPPVLVPIPQQGPYMGGGYGPRNASTAVGMQSPSSYHAL